MKPQDTSPFILVSNISFYFVGGIILVEVAWPWEGGKNSICIYIIINKVQVQVYQMVGDACHLASECKSQILVSPKVIPLK